MTRRSEINWHRDGYTLMELIVVIAILLVVTAMAIPAFLNWLADARAAAAADMVRARMTDARARAMADGKPWRLAYLANTGFLQLAPEESTEWDNVQTSNLRQAELIREELPKGILLVSGPDELVGKRDAGSAGNTWETIAIYLPNGSARDDSTTYFGKVGVMPARARLRALTGSVAIELPIDIKTATP